MKKWDVTFVDDHGNKAVERFDCEQEPSMEQAAQMILAKLLPVPAELDLNDLEGRTDDPTVKILKDQCSIEILSITQAP